MKNFFLAGAAALSLLAGCASGPTIRSHVDPSANLASYKTYMFAEKTGTDRPDYKTPITSYFKEAIRREMDARGYRYVEGGPADLLINFNANAGANPNAFNQGHNLHVLTLTTAASFTIPIFPPSC